MSRWSKKRGWSGNGMLEAQQQEKKSRFLRIFQTAPCTTQNNFIRTIYDIQQKHNNLLHDRSLHDLTSRISVLNRILLLLNQLSVTNHTACFLLWAPSPLRMVDHSCSTHYLTWPPLSTILVHGTAYPLYQSPFSSQGMLTAGIKISPSAGLSV